MTQAERGHHELMRRIASAGRRWRRRAAAHGLLRVLTPAIAAVVLYLALDALFVLPRGVRIVWLTGTAMFLLAGLAVLVVRPLMRKLDPVGIAARIEAEHPELGERLEASAELWEKRGRGKHGYSVELIDALIEKTVADAAGIDFGAVRGTARARRWALALGIVVVGALGLAGLGSRLGPALGRLARPFAVVETQAVTITVEPGDTTLLSGDDLIITATVTGPSGDGAVLTYEYEGEIPRERAMTSDVTGERTAVPDPSSESAHRATLGDVRTDLRYSVSVGETESPTYTATVIERPFVTGLRLDYEFPAYSGLLARTVDENNGDVTALTGTRIGLTLTASKPLESARLVFESGEPLPLEREGASVFRGGMLVVESATYSIEITDTDGLSNGDPATYSIVAVRDEYPLVRIVEPGEDREVPRDMSFPLVISALDDYGVSDLTIRYSIEGLATEGVLPLANLGRRGERELVKEAVWDLSETGILPGAVLVYFAEVTDNDRVSGPKISRSESYLIRFPSMAELYSEVSGDQDEMVDDLEELVDEQEDLREEFEEIQEELRSDPSVDWQKEEEIEAALERQEELAEEVGEMADKMSELTDKMSESDRVTLETLEKTEEITKLLDEVATEEMRELIEQIREAMEQISPEQVSQAMEQMEITQDDYLRRLEQTLNLLKRVKAEQDLADIANRAEDLAERQERLAEEAGQSPGGQQCERMSEEQAELSKEAEQLREDLEKAIEEMSQVDRQTAEQMQEAAEEMDMSGMLEKMEQARSSFMEKKPGEAGPMCQSASNDLLTLFTSLSSCQGGMACSLEQRDREATLRAIDELLGVSSEQEKVVDAVEDRARIPRSEIVELVAKETDLAESMSAIAERMFVVSKESFVIDPSVYRAFGIVEMFMIRAAAQIADGGASAGRREAREALGRVNGLIVSLLTANQSNSPSSGGSSMQQLMQQLQQMAEQQSQLNDSTEELRQRLEEMGMNPQLQRQLAEMKGQQQRILEEARRLAEEFGNRDEILGRLDDTVEQIENTLAEMERTGASQETIDRQRRILSRLLDAQRSLRRRDYTRERRSRSGDAYARTAPRALGDDVTRATQELREDLLRAMQRDYPSEYRELIRAYFEGLSADMLSDEPAPGRRGEVAP